MHRLYEKTRDFDGCLFRNIVSLRETEDLFDDLTTDPVTSQTAYATEIQAKQSVPCGQITRGFHYSTAIDYPFATEPYMASRYADGTFPAWYGALDLETTIHETAYHMVRQINDVEGCNEIVERERAVYTVACRALLLDLEGKEHDFPELVGNSYAFTQDIGRRLHREGHPGLIAPSARCDGLNGVIFNQAVLSDPRNHCYLLYRYNPQQRTLEVERTIGCVDWTLNFNS